MRRLVAWLPLVALIAGCTAIPRPREAMEPVSSPLSWAQSEPNPAPAATVLQPELLWQRAVSGQPHYLWWGGESLVVSGMNPVPFPWEDRFVQGFSTAGDLRWERDLAPARLIEAAVDPGGETILAIAQPSASGAILQLTPAGEERWRAPWENAWPRSLAVGDGCVAIGYDGQNGAFMGRLQTLDRSGLPLIPEMRDRLSGFAGIPSRDCSAVLVGYEGDRPSLYRSDLYRGSGVRLLDATGQERWALINYHRPLAITADGSLAVVAGIPSPDRAYQPPPQDPEPAPPFGQLLWLNRAGEIAGRYRLPFAATIEFFAIDQTGTESVVALSSHRFTGAPRPQEVRRIVWLTRGATGQQVAWERSLTNRLVDMRMAANGSSLLMAEQTAANEYWLTLLDRSGKMIWRYQHSAPVAAVALSPNGERAAALAEDGLAFFDTGLQAAR